MCKPSASPLKRRESESDDINGTTDGGGDLLDIQSRPPESADFKRQGVIECQVTLTWDTARLRAKSPDLPHHGSRRGPVKSGNLDYWSSAVIEGEQLLGRQHRRYSTPQYIAQNMIPAP